MSSKLISNISLQSVIYKIGSAQACVGLHVPVATKWGLKFKFSLQSENIWAGPYSNKGPVQDLGLRLKLELVG